MREIMEKKIRNIVFAYCAVVVLMVIFCLPVDLFARWEGPPKGHPNYEKVQTIKKYFESRYKGKKPELFGVKFYKGGSLKKINIHGDFTPKGLDTTRKTKNDVIRIANAFIEKEKKFLKLDKPYYTFNKSLNHGIKLVEGFDSDVLMYIYVHNIRYEGGLIHVFTDTKGRVRSFRAYLPPDTPEFNKVVARIKTDMLSEEEIVRRVRSEFVSIFEELFSNSDSLKINVGEKLIIKEAPYVIQEMGIGSYYLRVDVFTGEIVEKSR